MPTYDYKCTKCGEVFEVSHAMNKQPRVRCAKCKASAQRVISGGMGVVFKGSGFQTTDSRKTPCGAGKTCCGRDAPCDTCPAPED